MDEKLLQLIQTAVNSRAKLDVLVYYRRHPDVWESLTGLALLLNRTPADLETALCELAQAGLLAAQAGRLPGNELLYNCRTTDPTCGALSELLAACESDGREAVLQAVTLCEDESRACSLERQRAVDDMRTRFVSMVTHELRTPLTIIRAVLTTLASVDKSDTVQTAALLQRGVHQCDRLTSMVENVMMLAGLQTGRELELYLGEVELRRLLAELRGRVLCTDKHTVRLSLDNAPEVIVADEYLLGHTLEGLLANAIKFSPEGGEVTLTVTQQGSQALFAVEDEGIGMSERQIEQVFEPFYQTEPDASRLAGGLGLGLFMARAVIEAHGGEISLQPGDTGGLRVAFCLPLAGPSETCSP